MTAVAPDISLLNSLRVAIVLVNWNGWEDTVACLDSVFGLQHPNFTVFVVDNASSDGSVEKIGAWCRKPYAVSRENLRPGVQSATAAQPGQARRWIDVDFKTSPGPADIPEGTEIVLIRSGGNLGFAGGNNVGLKCAGLQRYDYFWLLNTDTLVDRQALTELLRRGVSDPSLGLIGSTLALYWEPHITQATGGGAFDFSKMQPSHLGEGLDVARLADTDPSSVEAKMAYVVGASMLASRGFVENVGLMMEDYFLYFEELDWAVRAVGHYRLGYAPRSVVYHKVGGSSARKASYRSAAILYRNRLKFVARYFPSRYRRVVLRLMFDEFPRHVLKLRWVDARALFAAFRSIGKAYREGVAGRPASYVEVSSLQPNALKGSS